MAQYLEAFLLGNAAILGNVCVLPLYPGLLAFLAGQGATGRTRGASWLGVLVLAGVLSLMLVVGLVLFTLRQSVAAFLPLLLPLAYGAVLLLGVLLLLGQNPFKGLAGTQAPVLRNPYATAYLYGLLLGPMTLPCTGPLIVSAFVLGAGDAVALADGLLYFLAFGLGFGWPLVALALVAAGTGRRLTSWFARREPAIQRLSGALLIGIALFGFWVDVRPNLRLATASARPAESAAIGLVAAPARPDPTAGQAATTTAHAQPAQAPAPLTTPTPAGAAAPELVGVTHWLNSAPLTLASLRGEVVLVHFWTFACSNCQATLPALTRWYATYRDQGFTVIGVHAPEFGFERETANVTEAARRYGITYPIAQDNDFATWEAYENHYWPTLYLVDANGVVRYRHIGEGAYDETEAMIRTLLAERQ
ncbi:MAG: redoxin domain-containing protein [Chloroflexales bacterium]|nr:redoxin domain-containing protein [Chloroflexales bacterium]